MSSTPAPKKHALLIGINEYSNFEEQYQLRGCVNDAKLMKNVLVEHFKFPESNIIELHNAAASQQGILGAMDLLVERVAQDDIVVFHFSGHGGQLRTNDTDEGSGMSSAICSADSGYMDPYPNLDIIDNVINEWLVRLTSKTRNVSLTFDCCHSGTMTRDAIGAKARGIPADTRSLADMGIDVSKLPPPRDTRFDKKTSGWLTLNDKFVVMSGCRDDELSYEFDFDGGDQTIRGGALTHYLTQALLNAKPGSTYRDVFELVRHGVNTQFKQQHPQIEGAQDREIFGVKDIEPFKFILINAINGENVTLAGGAAHGLVADSQWSVYPQGTKRTEGTLPLGEVKITSVGAITSQGVIIEGKDQLTVGARCVEIATPAKHFLLSVDISQLNSRHANAIAERVNASRLLTLSTKASTYDACAYILNPEDANDNELVLPSEITIQTPTWAFTDKARMLCMPLHEVANENSVNTIIENLEAIARYKNALRLDNPASKLDVELNIFYVDPQGASHNINGEDFVFEEGQCLALEIKNNEQTNVYVSLLDFNQTGQITLFYPQQRGSELIAPGNSITIGTDDMQIELGLPKDFIGNQGTETIKAIVTSDESDFRWLQQSGTRSIESDKSALREQFEAAYNGPPTRNLFIRKKTKDEGDWKAIARSFELKRANH